MILGEGFEIFSKILIFFKIWLAFAEGFSKWFDKFCYSILFIFSGWIIFLFKVAFVEPLFLFGDYYFISYFYY